MINDFSAGPTLYTSVPASYLTVEARRRGDVDPLLLDISQVYGVQLVRLF